MGYVDEATRRDSVPAGAGAGPALARRRVRPARAGSPRLRRAGGGRGGRIAARGGRRRREPGRSARSGGVDARARARCWTTPRRGPKPRAGRTAPPPSPGQRPRRAPGRPTPRRSPRAGSAREMRVAIDARELAGRPTGVGRYLAELLREWRDGVAARPRTGALQSSAAAGSRTGLAGTRRARVGRHALGTVGVRAGARPRQARCALRPGLHGAAGLSGTGGAGGPRRLLLRPPRVVHRPRRPAAPADHRVGGAPGARGAGALGVLGARDRALHRGARIARARSSTSASARPRPSSAPRQSSVLFVGSLFQRRRIDVLIDAFARLAAAHPEVHLDIVGENRTVPRVDYTAQVAALGLGGRLSVRHWVDDETLATLYAQATAFAFLSEYEGFGFTPLEALAHGAVPVVLDTPVAREIYGDAAVRVADGPDLVEAARRRARPPARRSRRRARRTWPRRRRCWPATAGPTRRRAPGATSRRRRVPDARRWRSSSSATTCAPSSSSACAAWRRTRRRAPRRSRSSTTPRPTARSRPSPASGRRCRRSPPAATSASPAPTTWGSAPRAATSCCC